VLGILSARLRADVTLAGSETQTRRRIQMSGPSRFRADEAKMVGDRLGIDWKAFDVEQFRRGMDVELEHGLRDAETNVTGDDIMMTGKIAWAHLKEFPDYYDRLEQMEEEAEAYWDAQKGK
jgi:hypothetical protein